MKTICCLLLVLVVSYSSCKKDDVTDACNGAICLYGGNCINGHCAITYPTQFVEGEYLVTREYSSYGVGNPSTTHTYYNDTFHITRVDSFTITTDHITFNMRYDSNSDSTKNRFYNPEHFGPHENYYLEVYKDFPDSVAAVYAYNTSYGGYITRLWGKKLY